MTNEFFVDFTYKDKTYQRVPDTMMNGCTNCAFYHSYVGCRDNAFECYELTSVYKEVKQSTEPNILFTTFTYSPEYKTLIKTSHGVKSSMSLDTVDLVDLYNYLKTYLEKQ